MKNNKAQIAIDPKAAAAAQKRVSAAQEKRRAERRRKFQTLAAKHTRLAALSSRRRKEVHDLQGRLAKPLSDAQKRTVKDSEFAKQSGPGPKFLHEQCGDRPLRLFIECTKPQKPKDVSALIAKALKIRDRSALPSVDYLFPRLIKKHRDLRRFVIVELGVNRRRGLPIGPRLADAIHRAGSFVSVRLEGLRSGVTSGTPLTGTGPNYQMAEPARRDWHLTDPTDALLDSNTADGQDVIGAIDAYGAWDVLGASAGQNGASAGAGIVIGHPDTGYREHADYPVGQIDTVRAYDAFDNASSMFAGFEQFEGIGRHPLTPTAFPYIVQHGTFTASVIVAPQSRDDRDGREMIGVAPGATILPLRCVDTVILAGDLELIRAIEHAIFTDVDVISISLGGSPHPALLDALRTAIEAGIIVVAAAGQPSGGFPLPNQVVAPAAWPEVIAVGGSIGGRAWFGCFSGPEVDFCAPAVEVERAGFNTDGSQRTGGGRGTSFATAMTAGAAALWLQHHGGRAAIQSSVPGVSVQQVFRHLARETSYRPSDLQSIGTDAGWPAGFGSGILNVRQLLEADLPQPSDVPGYDRFLPPNVYVVGSGIAVVDLNGRPVLDGGVVVISVLNTVTTAAGAASATLGTTIANMTAAGNAAVSAGLATWLGAVGAVRTIADGALAASGLATTWQDTLAAAGSVGGEVGAWLSDQADAAEEAWEDAEDAVDEALDEAADALDDFTEDTSEFLEDTAEEASETAAEIVDDVVGVFGSVFG